MELIHFNTRLYSQIKNGSPFVLYALPDDGFKEACWIKDCKVDIIQADAIGKETGFVFAPYEYLEHPIYLFKDQNPQSGESDIDSSNFFKKSLGEKITSPTKIEFENTIHKAQNAMLAEGLKKVVLSRPLVFENQTMLSNLGFAFTLLCEWYPDTLKYLIFTPCGKLWMGATPESLLAVDNSGKLSTMSLSGTKKANEDSEWTQKELDEHHWVVSYIESVLERSACVNILKEKIKTISSGPVEHLQTDFFAELKDKNSIADVIFGLHPTPAVCGFPLQKAKEFISSTENYDRAYYTGFLGPISDVNKKLFVNLRCMQLFPERVVLYVGAGITSDSVPEMEWRETDLKSKTLLRAIEKIANFAAAKSS